MQGSARSKWYCCASVAAALLAMMSVFAPRAARAQTCAGDCNNSMSVASDELVTLADIALGDDVSSACTNGIPSGATVDVVLILQAVNKAVGGCAGAPPGCGNGVTEAGLGEDCDNGSICVGGDNAGTSCSTTGESGCHGQGICVGGPKAEWVCDTDDNCPSGACKHCIPQEGNGCAANCTTESAVNINLVPGQSPDSGASLTTGTSGLGVYSQGLTVAVLIPTGTTRQLMAGKPGTDGKIPVVLKAEANQTKAIFVLSSACVCLRAVSLKTCGGALWEENGTPSTDCTAGYTTGDCTDQKPCTSVYGSDNVAAGTIGCNGLEGVNATVTQDSGGGGTAGPILTMLDGSGDAGSAVVYLTTELGFIIGSCTGVVSIYGADHTFCTDDDPQSSRGKLLTEVLTTGSATASVLNADGIPGNTVPAPPVVATVQGNPVSCDTLATGASGAALVDAFPDLNAAQQVGDIAVTGAQVAQ